MRMSNKLKIIMIIILAYIAIMLTPLALNAQGPPGGWPTGGNGGGPPPPPPNYCDANPDDPSCQGASVPIDQGDWLIVLVGLVGGTYLLNKKKIKIWN